MKRQLRDILHKYETVVETEDGGVDAICAPSYECLIIELIEFMEEENEKHN